MLEFLLIFLILLILGTLVAGWCVMFVDKRFVTEIISEKRYELLGAMKYMITGFKVTYLESKHHATTDRVRPLSLRKFGFYSSEPIIMADNGKKYDVVYDDTVNTPQLIVKKYLTQQMRLYNMFLYQLGAIKNKRHQGVITVHYTVVLPTNKRHFNEIDI